MFRSCYGYEKTILSNKLESKLIHKAIDFEESIEVFQIGFLSGEDIPFRGDIYVIRYKNQHIPFIISEEIIIDYVELDQFNLSAISTKRKGLIPVTIVKMSHVGCNLQSIKTGPRGSLLLYNNCFLDNNFSEFEFNVDFKKTDIINLIKLAIPVIYFDKYSLFKPMPSFCISVIHENDDDVEKIKSTIENDRMQSINICRNLKKTFIKDNYIDWFSVLNSLEERCTNIGISIEKITAELLDLERLIFIYGTGKYDRSFWKNERLYSLLKMTYNGGNRNLGISYERFIAEIITTIHDRVSSRVLFEGYPHNGWLTK